MDPNHVPPTATVADKPFLGAAVGNIVSLMAGTILSRMKSWIVY
jgi:hypothetical protein